MNLRRSLGVSFLGAQGVFIMNFAANIILSRLLLPHEIGLFSITVALLAIVHAVRDFGIGNYVIKEKDLTHEKMRTVFGVAILVGVTLFVVMQLCKNLIAAFYGHPEIGEILGIISFNFLIIPLGQPALAVLTRNMQFNRVAVIHIVSTLLHTSTAIFLAYQGFSYASLAYAALAGTACTAFLSLCFHPAHFLLLPAFKHWRETVAFGGFTTLANIVNNMGENLVEIVVGKLINPAAVGFYSRGYGLARAFEMVILQSLNGVMGAAFGQLHRADADMKKLYVDYTSSICFVAWPIYAVLGYFSVDIVVFLFGENWRMAGALLSILVFDRMVMCAALSAKEIYVGTGAMKTFLTVSSLVHGIALAIIVLAAYSGLTYVAYGKIACSAVALAVNLVAVKKLIAISYTHFFKALLAPFLMLCLTALVIAIYQYVNIQAGWFVMDLLIVSSVVACLMVTVAICCNQPIGREIRHMWQKLKPAS